MVTASWAASAAEHKATTAQLTNMDSPANSGGSTWPRQENSGAWIVVAAPIIAARVRPLTTGLAVSAA